tara:strand:- start:308 stop:508 length:201 start_codon:yes stop_codon:yes gene_type:complete
MKTTDKLSKIKKTIEEINDISEKLAKNNNYESEIYKLNLEISRLKKGISESVNELEEFLKEYDAKS